MCVGLKSITYSVTVLAKRRGDGVQSSILYVISCIYTIFSLLFV